LLTIAKRLRIEILFERLPKGRTPKPYEDGEAKALLRPGILAWRGMKGRRGNEMFAGGFSEPTPDREDHAATAGGLGSGTVSLPKRRLIVRNPMASRDAPDIRLSLPQSRKRRLFTLN
jgi:hypothetical protein